MAMENGKAAPEDIGRGRVEALSDGVFAIVVTLLVLELHVPQLSAHDSLGAGLAWMNEIAAFVCYGGIAVYFVFPHSMRTRR
jgi:uncharacterized membrane protein